MGKIKIKKMKASTYAYLEYKGPYGGIPFDEFYKRLYDWAKENKARPGFKPFAMYPDDPNKTPEAETRTYVCIPIGKDPGVEGDVKVCTLQEGEMAVLKHNAPAEEYANSYAELGKWIEENGYEVTAPPMEVYTGKPKVKGGKTIIKSIIQFTVKKK